MQSKLFEKCRKPTGHAKISSEYNLMWNLLSSGESGLMVHRAKISKGAEETDEKKEEKIEK